MGKEPFQTEFEGDSLRVTVGVKGGEAFMTLFWGSVAISAGRQSFSLYILSNFIIFFNISFCILVFTF